MIYRTIILPVVYGCETWSLTLKVESRLKVLENRVLRRIFGSKKDKIAGQCRKLNNKELKDLYSTSKISSRFKSRRMRMAGHVACMVERRGAYWAFVWKPEGKGPFGRPRCR